MDWPGGFGDDRKSKIEWPGQLVFPMSVLFIYRDEMRLIKLKEWSSGTYVMQELQRPKYIENGEAGVNDL